MSDKKRAKKGKKKKEKKKRKRKYERKDKKKKSPLFHIHIVAFLFGLKFKKGVKEVLLNTPPPSS